MSDVDRYVDRLYEGSLNDLKIPFIKTEWHRYAGDLNRIPEDIDASTVIGALQPAGKNARGFLWAITTHEVPLMKAPIPQEQHQKLVELIYKPFHSSIADLVKKAQDDSKSEIFHLDLHSMPSIGTSQHRDPGERRADIVVSDSKGLSANSDFVDLVIASYARAGFKVGYNWPYFGGRLTEQYGKPSSNHHTVQVELNRGLYMNEEDKKIKNEVLKDIQGRLRKAIEAIQKGVIECR